MAEYDAKDTGIVFRIVCFILHGMLLFSFMHYIAFMVLFLMVCFYSA